MAVTSSTVGGVNCWQFSGAVTDTQIQTAWAALVSSGVYVINRAIYLDNTADLTGVTGGFLVNFGTQVSPAFILHTGRDKTKSTFNNFTFLQSTGLSVGSRGTMVKTWNGTALIEQGGGVGADGLSQKGGGMVYGVAGNPGGADPRYLNEMEFSGLDGSTVYSQEFTEQELQPCVGATTVMRGLAFEKCFGFPQIGTATGNTNVVVYRSTQNTQHATQYPVRIYPVGNRYGAVCYVDSYTTRNNADITTRLGDFYGTNATNLAVVMILNNYTKGSWFGVSNTAFSGLGNWYSGNQIIGGVLKKIQFVGGSGGVVRCYDSRSTTTAQKCAFLESGTIDFLDTSLAPTCDANGKITLVHVGAIATGASASITRYTGQKYTFQKFAYRVIVAAPDMTAGDNDLSAFTPVTLTAQDGIARSQAAISAATTLASFQDLLEELHVLAIGLTGADSYNGAYAGNLFNFSSGVLTTSFAAVNVNPSAASKISYNAATNVLTVKSSSMTDTATVSKWVNAAGPINLLNGAKILGIYQSATATSARLTTSGLISSALAVLDHAGAIYDFTSLSGSKVEYFDPGKTGIWTAIAERLGYKRQTMTFNPGAGGDFTFSPVWIPDTSVIVTDPAVLSAYTTVADQNQTLDRIAYERTTSEQIPFDRVYKDGVYLNWGSADVRFVASAADPVVYDASLNKFTVAVGAARQPGTTMFGDRTTGHITADAGVAILSAYVDADGLRVLVSGLNPLGFDVTWHLRYKLHAASTWTVLSGTGNSAAILMTEALYDVQVRTPGYEWKTTSIDTAKTQTLDMQLSQQTTATGLPQYTQAFDPVIEQSFSYDASAAKVAVANTTGQLVYPGFNEVYRAIQRIMHIEALVWLWSNPVTYNSQAQKVIIPTGNPISMYLTEPSTASVIFTCQVVHEASGASAEDRVKANTTGFFIKLGNQATADSASIASTIIGQLGGPSFVSGTHGLSAIKDAIAAADTHVQAVAGNVWAQTTRTLTSQGASGATLAEIEASTVLAKESTAAAIKAKTDALQNTDLSGVATAAQVTALGTPLQAGDYTAPDNATLDQIKTKVDTLENADLSGVATAAQVTALGTPMQAGDYTAPDNATIGQIKVKVDTLESADLSGVATAQALQGVADKLTEVVGAIDDLQGMV